MAPKIYNIKEPFDLERLRLAKPLNKNGTHFIKTLDMDNPIYFLCPKCFTKQGFVKSGKKIFCDFVFSNEDSEFLNWLENLEECSRKWIYENRESWFETQLDEHDIESSMSPPYKSYKSGKYFIVRANVPTILDKINIKVYDENENETEPENIRENTKVLAVFEFQGIRCNTRSFQFEIELKQLLIVEPEKIFEKCIIGTSSIVKKECINDSSVNEFKESLIYDVSTNDVVNNAVNHIETEIDEQSTASEKTVANTELTEDANTISNIELEEIVDLNLEDEPDPPLKLKPRNDVYYRLYKETRQRAKQAKREALANFLEAKRIKNTYLLEYLSDSDESDDDFQTQE